MNNVLVMKRQNLHEVETALIGVFAGDELLHHQRVGVRWKRDLEWRVLDPVTFLSKPCLITHVIVDLDGLAVRESIRLGALANGRDPVTLLFADQP